MNKKIISFLVAITVASSAFASESNNKTCLNVRVCRDNVPAYTTFHQLESDTKEGLGGKLEVTAFYGQSTNGRELAKSFGADGNGSIAITRDGSAPAYPSVWNNYLLHVYDKQGDNNLVGTLNFDPKQTVYGARFDYVQGFDKWLDGLYLHIALPITNVENDLNLEITGASNGATSIENFSLYDLLTGKARPYASDALQANNQQDCLKYAKMTHNERTGLGDLEVRVGWNFIKGDKYHVGINVCGIAPTAPDREGHYLWEAEVGENKWGLGGGTDMSAILWEKDTRVFRLLSSVQYTYLFEGEEKRTLGLKEFDGSKSPIMSAYHLIGEKDAKGLKPLANVSTMDVDVKMGSKVDGIVSFAYNSGNFTMDLGYNVFWKEAEKVQLKGLNSDPCGSSACTTACTNGCGCSTWSDDKFAIAKGDYNTADAFVIATHGVTGKAIKAHELDTAAAATPAQVSHKIFTGFGYIFKSWDYPLMVGVGASYEWPSTSRDVPEGYGMWVKTGIAF